MRSFAFVTIAVWLTALALVGSAEGNSNRNNEVLQLRHAITYHRDATWHYQDRAGVRRTPSVHAERHTRSIPFLAWINRTWFHRMERAEKLHHAGLPFTNDWVTAVNIVQRTWPGTKAWLLGTSSGEGGWGICVWNGGAPCTSSEHGSGAAGWLQYMSGTFYGNLRAALAEARLLHRPLIPRSAKNWFSPLGQAFAGGWGCSHNPGAWSRPSC